MRGRANKAREQNSQRDKRKKPTRARFLRPLSFISRNDQRAAIYRARLRFISARFPPTSPPHASAENIYIYIYASDARPLSDTCTKRSPGKKVFRRQKKVGL